jgi:hypothetical protein
VTGFGGGGFGLGGFGGDGEILVLAVVPVSSNVAAVEFDRPPLALDPTDPHDATNPATYGVAAVDPTYTSDTVPEGVLAPGAIVPTRQPLLARVVLDPDDPSRVLLEFDAPLEPGVLHSVSVSAAMCGASDEALVGDLTWYFWPPSSVRPQAPAAAAEERYRDLDFVMTPEDGLVGGTYRHDANGDVGIQGRRASRRKRIFRRLFSGRGAWAILPDYGTAVALKTLGRRDTIQDFASRAAEQVRREPDVATATVAARVTVLAQGAFLDVDVWITDVDNRSDYYAFRTPHRQ